MCSFERNARRICQPPWLHRPSDGWQELFQRRSQRAHYSAWTAPCQYIVGRIRSIFPSNLQKGNCHISRIYGSTGHISEPIDLEFLLEHVQGNSTAEPHSFTLTSVHEDLSHDSKVIGYVIGVVPWSSFFRNGQADPIVVDVRSDCGSNLTRRENGTWEDGIHHDKFYNYLRYVVLWRAPTTIEVSIIETDQALQVCSSLKVLLTALTTPIGTLRMPTMTIQCKLWFLIWAVTRFCGKLAGITTCTPWRLQYFGYFLRKIDLHSRKPVGFFRWLLSEGARWSSYNPGKYLYRENRYFGLRSLKIVVYHQIVHSARNRGHDSCQCFDMLH